MRNNNTYSAKWIIDEQWLRDNSFIDFDLHSKYIRVAIQFLHDDLLTRVFGDCFAEQLSLMVAKGTIHKKHHYNRIVRDYVSQIFIWGIPYVINIPLTFQSKNQGVVKMSGDGFQSMEPMNDMKQLNAHYKTNMDPYVKRLIDYLKTIKSTIKNDFPDCSLPCLHEDHYIHTLKPNYPPTQYQLWKR